MAPDARHNEAERQACIREFLRLPSQYAGIAPTRGQGFYLDGSTLYTKPPRMAKNPAGAIIGEWSSGKVRIHNSKSPLGKDLVKTAREAGIEVEIVS